jgi:hypothetical protein
LSASATGWCTSGPHGIDAGKKRQTKGSYVASFHLTG